MFSYVMIKRIDVGVLDQPTTVWSDRQAQRRPAGISDQIQVKQLVRGDDKLDRARPTSGLVDREADIARAISDA